jgi:hypothetical protein
MTNVVKFDENVDDTIIITCDFGQEKDEWSSRKCAVL